MQPIILIDRSKQNKKGEAIKDFKAYFDELASRTTYIKASTIVRTKFNIIVCVK